MGESSKAPTSKEAVSDRRKCHWGMFISDREGGFSRETVHLEEVLPLKKEALTMLPGSLLPEDAFEPCHMSMAISACWPGEELIVPEVAALHLGKPVALGVDRPSKFCLLTWRPEGKANLGVRQFSPCRVQSPTQQDTLAKRLLLMARHCWKRLWTAEQISDRCTQEYDRKCYYPN